MKKYEYYRHHGNWVWVDSELQGKHREYCLCHACKRLNTGDRDENCPRANLLYAFCRAFDMTTPVFECPEFREKEPCQTSNP